MSRKLCYNFLSRHAEIGNGSCSVRTITPFFNRGIRKVWRQQRHNVGCKEPVWTHLSAAGCNELKMQVRPCRISSITDTPDALTAHDRITFLYIDLRQMCV